MDNLKDSVTNSALTTLFLTLAHELNAEELRSEGLDEESIYIRTQTIRAGLLLLLNYHPARIIITPFIQHYFYRMFMDDRYHVKHTRYGYFHEKHTVTHLNEDYKFKIGDKDTRKEHEKDPYTETIETIEPDPTAEAVASNLTLLCFVLYDIYASPASLSESIPTVLVSAAASYVTKHAVHNINESYKHDGVRGIAASLFQGVKSAALWLAEADFESTSTSSKTGKDKAWRSFSF